MPPEMETHPTNPNQLLIDNYEFNLMIVKALKEVFARSDRQIVDRWVSKMEEMCHTPEQLLYRSHYMWFLLLVMQRSKLTSPFDIPPPHGTLKPLHEVLPVEAYHAIINSATSRQPAVDKAIKELAEKAVTEDESKKGLFPCNFFSTQPVPQEGSFCYAAVFSDFSTNPQGV